MMDEEILTLKNTHARIMQYYCRENTKLEKETKKLEDETKKLLRENTRLKQIIQLYNIENKIVIPEENSILIE